MKENSFLINPHPFSRVKEGRKMRRMKKGNLIYWWDIPVSAGAVATFSSMFVGTQEAHKCQGLNLVQS